jgi:phosphoserine aminotransferase
VKTKKKQKVIGGEGVTMRVLRFRVMATLREREGGVAKGF